MLADRYLRLDRLVLLVENSVRPVQHTQDERIGEARRAGCGDVDEECCGGKELCYGQVEGLRRKLERKVD